MNKIQVKFVGCSDRQINFGRSIDPRPHLVVGQVYEIVKKDVHSFHTLIHLKGYDNKPFNSVCFMNLG